ncbi:1-acylglycerol-3-phosphate O-acyltransferase [Knoellia koreensis]|uniref:1-acyl-sn-glycerol-3-phosphate acyltransferase n=1 Tax=Knoellia koreensis TaxID=2730921 RepID=A0A849HDF1_9MICO|nr:1-acyl-sn-glycerol-3-phosphate acyltransferase [Knoellia sp. DB2414S]
MPALVAGSLWTLALATAITLCPRGWRSADLTNRLLSLWSQGWLFATGANVVIEGAQHLHGIGACVVVSNHQSNLDPIVLTSTFGGRIRILTKRELFRVPLLGSALRTMGMVEVNRDSPDRATIAAGAAHALDQGLPLLVFPEGTTSRTGDLLPFKPGAFQIAIRHGVPIIPVLVTDSREVWPAKRLKVKAATVRVVVTAPLATEGLAESRVVDLSAMVRGRLENAWRVRSEGQHPRGIAT